MGSLRTSTHAEPQAISGEPHVGVHAPFEQASPDGQLVPHTPQFALSVCRFAQYGAPASWLHSVNGAPHVAGQAAPHAPQFALSVLRSAQYAPPSSAQSNSPAGHDSASGSAGASACPFSFVKGISGKALALPFGSSVTFPGTGAVLSAAPALTVSVWVRVSEPSATQGRTYLGCRSEPNGFETYSGIGGGSFTTCAGYGGWPPPWGACATVDPLCSLAQFSHFVLRWRGPGHAPEVAADGGPWATLNSQSLDGGPYPMPAGFNLFEGATDLVTGIGAGDGSDAAGSFEVDSIRVYDTALANDVVWSVTACPVP